MRKSAILLLSLVIFTLVGCGNRKSTRQAPPEETSVEAAAQTPLAAIDNYLSGAIASLYAPGEVCIPFQNYLSIDESQPEDILAWGDFWVLNYVVSGDTLKTVSGGNHPGKMHIRKDGEGHYEVTGFDRVTDGAGYEPSAKAIFGDRYSAFQTAHADDAAREEARQAALSSYVAGHHLSVRLYQDYGWPAVPIPIP